MGAVAEINAQKLKTSKTKPTRQPSAIPAHFINIFYHTGDTNDTVWSPNRQHNNSYGNHATFEGLGSGFSAPELRNPLGYVHDVVDGAAATGYTPMFTFFKVTPRGTEVSKDLNKHLKLWAQKVATQFELKTPQCLELGMLMDQLDKISEGLISF
ncbi:hypothetical protein BKA82DRAFT_4019362 [Pisolithus tinctorius]|nr:hypothetical protein BKA82DRAFT_4019362 [Pisolithus tinctorius]